MFCLWMLCFFCFVNVGLSELWCYSCVSADPGCEEFYLDWRIHHAITCPKENDKCVKVIEKKGAEKFITRDCLSNLEGQRKDIPADRYDGCRLAATQPKLSVFVENHVSQMEIKKQHYEEVTYCFCEFDQWCNSAVTCGITKAVIMMATVFPFIWWHFHNML